MNWKLLILLPVLLLTTTAVPAFAQQSDEVNVEWDPESGVPLRQGWHVEWFRGGEARTEPGSDLVGEVAIVWSDTRSTDRGIYLQVVDTAGAFKFDGYGIKITDVSGRQEDPGVWPSRSNGDWFIAWEDFDLDTLGDIYVTKVNARGEPIWADGRGVPVCTFPRSFQEQVRIVEDRDGGCIVAWLDKRRGDTGDLFAMHITSDGEPDPEWPENGIAIVAEAGAQTKHTADIDGDGGMIIGWQDGRDDDDTNIWAQRITPEGELMWGNGEGIMVCVNQAVQESPKMCPDGVGGAFFTWKDDRNSESTGVDIYAQRLDENGGRQWGDGGSAVCDVEREQLNNRVVVSGNGRAIVMWQDKRSDNDTYDIYTQKISGVNAMSKEWGRDFPDGVPVIVRVRNQQQARLYPDGTGGAYYVWEDERESGFPEIDIFGQYIDNNGTKQWSEQGLAVCELPGTQMSPLVRASSAYGGSAVFVWEDQRTGSKTIYAQLITRGGEVKWDENGIAVVDSIDGNAQDLKLLSRLDGNFNLLWSDGRRGGRGQIPYVQFARDAGDHPEFLLANDGVPVMSDNSLIGGSANPDMANDGEGGTFVVWEDHRVGDNPNSIYGQYISPDGEILWGESGLMISEADDIYEKSKPQVSYDGEGGIWVVWTSNTPDTYINIFVQHLNAQGEFLVDEELSRLTIHEMDETVEAILPDMEGGAVILWQANNELAGIDQDLWIERLDPYGEALWADDPDVSGGKVLCDAPEKQADPQMLYDNSGYMIVWVDSRNVDDEIQTDIYGQFIDRNGNNRWRANGAGICTFEYHQDSPSIERDNDGNIWVAWVDHRFIGGNRRRDIYIQKVSHRRNDSFNAQPLLIGENNRPATFGVPVCSAVNDQVNPILARDGQNGVWVLWEDFRSGVWSDIYGTHLNPDGIAYEVWEENGGEICGAFHRQESPKAMRLVSRGAEGIVAAWIDKRATGKQELFNIFVQKVDDHVLAVNEPSIDVAPSDYVLEEAFPNPFNSTTVISYITPREGRISLKLYDLTGRFVKEISSGVVQSGRHRTVIEGREFAAGVYLVRLEAEDVQLERKIQLIK